MHVGLLTDSWHPTLLEALMSWHPTSLEVVAGWLVLQCAESMATRSAWRTTLVLSVVSCLLVCATAALLVHLSPRKFNIQAPTIPHCPQ